MTLPRSSRAGLAVTGALALLFSTGAAVATESPGTGIDWTSCPGQPQAGAECSTLAVPLNHDRPRAGSISVALARLPALDPSKRIGTLVLNPGGPGGSGVGAIAYDPTLASLPELATVRERFDIVGFDPRGVGASTPVVCPTPLHDPTIDLFPRSRADFRALVRFNKAAGQGCRDATGALIAQVDTRSVIDDVDAIRQALGEQQISWVGLSYGTEIGALYAEKYPRRVRAMVLDGVVDHSTPTRIAAMEQAQAIEGALLRFASRCGSSPECPLQGQPVLDLYDGVIAAAERGELPAAALGRPATAVEVSAGAFAILQLRPAWPQLAGALAVAAGLAGPADASALVGQATFLNDTYPAYRTVGCHDFAPRTRGWRDLAAQGGNLRAVAPHTWRYSEFWDWTSGCAGWPVKAANPPARLEVRGTAPILLVGNRYDPATPLAWARRVQHSIAGSRLLTVDSDGHTAILHSSCARTQMARYLVDGTLPPSGSVCVPSPGEPG